MQDEDEEGGEVLSCTSLQEGVTICIAPMERRVGGWAEEHFHDKLVIPSGENKMRGVVVMLE
eukprot:2504110-Ditylum_brightwellii.AAC.1